MKTGKKKGNKEDENGYHVEMGTPTSSLYMRRENTPCCIK